jgi:hypothetical protein
MQQVIAVVIAVKESCMPGDGCQLVYPVADYSVCLLPANWSYHSLLCKLCM